MISCANHDYIEIACMYGYEVRLFLKSGIVLQGKAFQTAYNDRREECIILKVESGNEEIVMEQIMAMEAVTVNPHFEKINFE